MSSQHRFLSQLLRCEFLEKLPTVVLVLLLKLLLHVLQLTPWQSTAPTDAGIQPRYR